MHLRIVDAGSALQPVEQRAARPARALEHDFEAFRHDTRNVVRESAAGDVRKAAHRQSCREREHRLDVDPGRGEQRIEQRLTIELGRRVRAGHRDELANQRVAVRMRAARGEAEHYIAGPHPLAIQNGFLLDHADAEAGEVVIVAVVHARHLRRLTAHQRTAGLDAAFDDAGDHALRDIDHQLAGGVIIEEEQRLCATHRDVVDAHCDEVDADPVMPPRIDREPQLGADAIGAGHQYGTFPAAGRDLHQRPKTADPGKHFRPLRTLDERFDPVDEFVAGVDVDPRVAIGDAGSLAALHVFPRPRGVKKGLWYCTGVGGPPPARNIATSNPRLIEA